ncbi:MAG: polysaccharide deacetylase family protein [Clostridia bacterium]|nr:polysaccharide deacetylase family protein [Clostridia bacterium]
MRRKRNFTLISAASAFVLSLAFAVNTLFYASASPKSAREAEKTPPSAVSSEEVEGQPSIEISALSPKKICWGQGRNYDSLNRPHDAVTSQEKYGELGGFFVDLACSDASEKSKKIFLTFDEGYENGHTAEILDTLKEKNVKAVFFITGDYAKREGDLVQRMIEEGQVVGNHTWRHYSMPEKPLATCREEIGLLHDYVKENFGYDMNVLRPPKGEFSEQTLALAKNMGYRTCLWSFAYKDWDTNAPGDRAQSLRNLTERLHPGAIYLLHAVSPTNAAILGDFIDAARAQGYAFVTP